METDKLWYLKWFLITKLDFGLEFALQIARQTLEQRILAELEETDEKLFTGADATLDLRGLGEKQEFWVEVVHNRKGEWLDFRFGKGLLSWKIRVTRKLRGRELKELTVELWEERSGKSAKLNEKEVVFLYEGFE